jgi:hypothetical protein
VLARVACGLAVLWLLGAGVAKAQDFPEGTFATDKESCTELATKTPAELGDDLDFQVLSKKGLIAFQQVCDFVSVVAHDASSWVATAFCDEDGYTYPDLFSIKQRGDGRLNVTRVTDLTQGSSVQDAGTTGTTDTPGADEGSAAKEDEGPAPKDEPARGEDAKDGAAAAGEQSEPSSEELAAESYSSFVKCQSVKP